MSNLIMAFDQGTTSSRCIIFDHAGKIVSLAQREFPQIYPQSGWVEQNPREIWSSQISVATEAMAQSFLTSADIKAIGITNQRETTIIWDRETGEPIHNAIVWQCRRTASYIEELKTAGLEDYVRATTGLIPDAYFSATKIAWLLDNVPEARKRAEQGELVFGTVDTWLMWNMSGGRVHATDYTNASRTMLFDIHRLCWDESLLSNWGIPLTMMPEVHPSGYHFGDTDRTLLGGEIPITGVAGDQQAALFGQCCFAKGEIKNTYGTGCFLLMNTGNEAITSRNGLITTIAATSNATPGTVEYALEGSVFIGGAAVKWLRDELRVIETAAETSLCAESVNDTEGVYLVPAFTGLGAPHWNPYARGVMVGITRAFSKEHLIRATLEAIAYQTADVIKAMEEDAGICISRLKVDGGASNNDFLLQFQADILGSSVCRPECVETTAWGSACLAGLTIGVWDDISDIKDNWQLAKIFTPTFTNERRQELLSGWEHALACALRAYPQ
ncbi:MAG: glycerol kinase GlpK [Lachnospiraceae bacterium]|jgi:glycerol kinase|nr:glycerol kinase GlpK [Lachnospiraceae bacterium]